MTRDLLNRNLRCPFCASHRFGFRSSCIDHVERRHLPTPQLLRKYDLLQFSEVVQAVKEGNLRRLNDALVQHDAFFIRYGVYFIL